MMKNKQYKLVVLVIIFLVFCFIFQLEDENTIILEIDANEKVLLESIIDRYLDKNIKDNTSNRNFFYQKDGVLTFFEYKLLGIDQSKIYIWLIKADYSNIAGSINRQNLVSLPFILKYRKNSSNISIIGYAFPRDGMKYGKDIIRLFPRDIIDVFPQDEEKIILEESLNYKASEKLNK